MIILCLSTGGNYRSFLTFITFVSICIHTRIETNTGTNNARADKGQRNEDAHCNKQSGDSKGMSRAQEQALIPKTGQTGIV